MQQNNHHDKDYSSNARSEPESRTIVKEKIKQIKYKEHNKTKQTE